MAIVIFNIETAHPEQGYDKVIKTLKGFGLTNVRDRYTGSVYEPSKELFEELGFEDYQVLSYQDKKLVNPKPDVPLKIRIYPGLIFEGGQLYFNHGFAKRKKDNGEIVPFMGYYNNGDSGNFCMGSSNPYQIARYIEHNILPKYRLPKQYGMRITYDKAVGWLEENFVSLYKDISQAFHGHMLMVIKHVDRRLAKQHCIAPPDLPSIAELDNFLANLNWKETKTAFWRTPGFKGENL